MSSLKYVTWQVNCSFCGKHLSEAGIGGYRRNELHGRFEPLCEACWQKRKEP